MAEDYTENNLNIGKRIHTYLELSAILETRNSKYFDYKNLENNIYRPTIQGVKDVKKSNSLSF
jgi:hypothetical protein